MCQTHLSRAAAIFAEVGLGTRLGIVWLARPSHLIAGVLRTGKGRSSSHLFSTNQMLLAGIRANSIHSLRGLSDAYYALWQWISFWLEIEPPGAERVGVRPLARFELERTREQKKPYLAKRASWCPHSQSLSERLGSTIDILYRISMVARTTQTLFSSDAQLSCVTFTNASPTIVSFPVSISRLYLSLSGLQQQMQNGLYISNSFIPHMVRPNY